MYRYVWSQYSQMNICIHTVPCHPTWYSHASSLHHNTTLYRCHTKAPKCQQFGVTLPGTKSTSCVNILPKTNIAPEKLGRAPKGDCLLQPVIFLFEFVVSFRGWVCFLRLAKIQEWWRKDSPQIGWRPKTPQNSFNSGVMNWWWFRLVQTSGLFVLVDMDNIILKHHEEMGFWIFLRIFWGEKNPQKNVVETSRVFTYNINRRKLHVQSTHWVISIRNLGKLSYLMKSCSPFHPTKGQWGQRENMDPMGHTLRCACLRGQVFSRLQRDDWFTTNYWCKGD